MMKEKRPRPEFELLVRCCGLARNLPVHGATSQAQLPDGFDEELFVSLATRHKVAEAAHRGLRKLGLNLGPGKMLLLKRNAIQYKLVRGLIIEGACAIIAAAEKQGIPAMVIKGPASSIQLWNDPLIREYNDLDILVNCPDVGPAIPFMAGLGFITEEFRPTRTSVPTDTRLLQRPHHLTFWKEGCPFRVEMHDRTGWESELFRHDDIDLVFRRAVTLECSGRHLVAPDLPDHAALIVAHGVKHAWCLLHWVLDAAGFLAQAGEEEQRAALTRMRELGMGHQIKLTCDMVRILYPVKLSPVLESAIAREPGFRRPLDFAVARLQTAGSDMASVKNTIMFDLVYSLPLLGDARDRRASAFRAFRIPQMDAEMVPLPRRLFFLHYFLRPFLVVLRRIRNYREKRARLHA